MILSAIRILAKPAKENPTAVISGAGNAWLFVLHGAAYRCLKTLPRIVHLCDSSRSVADAAPTPRTWWRSQ